MESAQQILKCRELLKVILDRIPGAICWFHAEGQDAGYDIIVKLDQIQKHMENTCQVRLLETGV